MCAALKRCAYRHKGKIMENTNIVTTEQQAPNTISASNAIFNVQALGQLTAFANLMADSQVTVPAHLAGKPADCMAIVMQAMQRCTRTQEITRDKNGKNGKYTVTERVRGWTDEDEIGLFVQVGAILRGESEITWGEPLYLSGVVTRNSPLWVSNPKQQIAYLGVKYWARLYCPEVILGVYSPDEVEQREEREINPAPVQRMSVQEITSEVSTRTSAQESAANVDAVADDLRERIDTASSVDQAKAIRADIESQKALLGTALFTELKNKAVKRYYQVDAQNKVEAVINSIPNPGEPEAAEMFAKAESTLGAAKRHLGDELHDKYRVTLDDMKPEYIG
ncbi:recombinase RecT [Salmonella enterica]|uniref:recombinase RecT n=1 Tax=Salmonella enterica TaxID=28901 RepID=UPI000E304E0B|nr:recombinase RecT [Salmonella enterica]